MHLAGYATDNKVPSAAGEDPKIHSRSVIYCPLLATSSYGQLQHNIQCISEGKTRYLNHCVFLLADPLEETEEHADLSKALAQIREVIAAVDLSVSEYERHQRLQEVWSRMENRSSAKLKNGHTFRKQDMMGPGQTLKHQGVLLWKTATGRLKGETDVCCWINPNCASFLHAYSMYIM